ncbi:PAS domain-containing protein [Parvibaculaceae bacterium PLY_AMNH_Bact1]|nr:PAS domain-containing protein [Parvibaculaceae bacterium PLY_AMNH_Bact1]
MSENFLTGNEVSFGNDEIIVSKTNLKGHITYCNDVFLRVSGYTEKELLGQPHSIIRHPDMPRSVFKLLWDTLAGGSEIFAYVNNRTKKGDSYWVLAHVTPSWDARRNIIGYHSNRRVPDRSLIEQTIAPLYAKLLAEEKSHANRKTGMQAAYQTLVEVLKDAGMEYDEFIATLRAA